MVVITSSLHKKKIALYLNTVKFICMICISGILKRLFFCDNRPESKPVHDFQVSPHHVASYENSVLSKIMNEDKFLWNIEIN